MSFKPNEILILWDMVKPQYINGLIQGYTVYYTEIKDYDYNYKGRTENVTITDPNVFRMVLRGLNTGSTYRIEVAGFTSVGEGPRSPWLSVVAGEYK